MATVMWCRRSGASGTATWPSAGRRMPTRCWKSPLVPVMRSRATPGVAWMALPSNAPATLRASRNATCPAPGTRCRPTCTTTRPTT
ncbi:hypothetical protein G6F32_014919 [Rhizopus arrhizus]|nr:hypothetical protein G6F32_014919 [Rhizopus arrhizus]